MPAEHIDHCLRAFVGMTRLTDLVCLALFEDHVTVAGVAKIEACGWTVERLS